MCPIFIYWILQVLRDPKVSKSLANQGLLACLFDSNCHCYCHAYHIERCLEVQDVVLIALLVDVLNGHLRVEELIKI